MGWFRFLASVFLFLFIACFAFLLALLVLVFFAVSVVLVVLALFFGIVVCAGVLDFLVVDFSSLACKMSDVLTHYLKALDKQSSQTFSILCLVLNLKYFSDDL